MSSAHIKWPAVCRRITLLVALPVAVVAAPAQAGPVAETDVRTAVQTWVRLVTADARPDAVVERMEPYRVDGETVAFIAHLEGGGFCLCGADEVVLPVYLYTPDGSWDPANTEYQYILEEIAGRVKAGRQALADTGSPASLRAAYRDRAATWRTLISGRAPARPPASALAAPSYLLLPLTATWGQGSPYNDQCPELTPGADEHVLVGCNAIATVQIMYYWKWPTTGVGADHATYPYRYRIGWDSEWLGIDPGIPAGWEARLAYSTSFHTLSMTGYWDNSVMAAAKGISSNSAYRTALAALWGRMTQVSSTPSADFGAATYDWSLIEDVHTDPPDAGDAEAAKVIGHVAIAVDTDFGIWDSRSYFGNDVAGIKDHFRYDPDALFTNSVENGGAGADPASLVEEIQWGRPAGLGGTNAAGGGHAWVVDGYNTAVNPTQFHMNLGWNGDENDWYTLDTAPLPYKHDMMTRIAPLNVRFVGAMSPGDGSPDSPYGGVEQAVTQAPDWSTLIFKAGSVNTFAASTLRINRPLRLKGWGATIRR